MGAIQMGGENWTRVVEVVSRETRSRCFGVRAERWNHCSFERNLSREGNPFWQFGLVRRGLNPFLIDREEEDTQANFTGVDFP